MAEPPGAPKNMNKQPWRNKRSSGIIIKCFGWNLMEYKNRTETNNCCSNLEKPPLDRPGPCGTSPWGPLRTLTGPPTDLYGPTGPLRAYGRRGPTGQLRAHGPTWHGRIPEREGYTRSYNKGSRKCANRNVVDDDDDADAWFMMLRWWGAGWWC